MMDSEKPRGTTLGLMYYVGAMVVIGTVIAIAAYLAS